MIERRDFFKPFLPLAGLLLLIWAPFLFLPVTGNFASRVFPYVMFAKNYLAGTPFYYPTADIIVGGEKTIAFLDFPFISLFAALLKKLWVAADIVFLGRLVSMVSTFLSIGLMLKIGRTFLEEREVRWAILFFAVSPLTLLYGMSFQNEAICLLFLLLSAHEAIRFGAKGGMETFLSSAVMLGLAEAGRLHYGYALLPIAWLIFQASIGRRILITTLFILFSQLIPIFWYGFCYWGTQTHDNVIWSIFYQTGSKGIEFLWTKDFIIYGLKNLLVLGFGVVGVVYFFIGMFKAVKKRNIFLLLWFLAALMPFLLLPKKIIDHNYYLFPLVPLLSLGCGVGFQAFLSAKDGLAPKRFFALGTLFFYGLIVFFVYFRAGEATLKLSPKILADAKAIRQHTEKKDRVIYVGFAPETMLYAERDGWNLPHRPTLPFYLRQNLIQRGALDDLRQLEQAEGMGPWITYYYSQGAAAIAFDASLPENLPPVDQLVPLSLERVSQENGIRLYRIKNSSI